MPESYSRERLLQGDWTSPREGCPQCGAHLLVNGAGVKWCSFIRCDYVTSQFAPSSHAAAASSVGGAKSGGGDG